MDLVKIAVDAVVKDFMAHRPPGWSQMDHEAQIEHVLEGLGMLLPQLEEEPRQRLAEHVVEELNRPTTGGGDDDSPRCEADRAGNFME